MIWHDSINENDARGRGIFINKGGEGKLVWLCYIAWRGVTRLFGVKIVFCYYCWSTDGPTPACYHDFYQRLLDKLLVCSVIVMQINILLISLRFGHKLNQD